MDRLKEIVNNYSRWRNLSTHITRIEYQINDDLTSAIGSAKSLLESICKTILEHERVEYSKSDSVNNLVQKTITVLKIELPDKISIFGNALVTATQTLGELRSLIDESSHGKSLLDKNKKIDSITASFLITSAETIACFLIEFYEIEHPRKTEKDEFSIEELKNIYDYKGKDPYDDIKDFHVYLDNEHGFAEIANIPYATSEALFAVDITAYKDEYRKYREVVNEQDN